MRNLSKHQKNNVIIGGLLCIVLLMMVGYAAFASKLNISGTSNITSNWDIEITNIESKNIVGSASNSSDPTYSGLTATFNTNLVSPGDSITYDITVKNKGSIDANLKSITKTDTSNSAILFETSGLIEGGTLQAGKSAILTVKVTYDSGVTKQPENLTSTLKVTLDFVQNIGDILPIEPEPIMMARDDSKAFWHTVYNSRISTVDVLTNKDVPSYAVESWDVSEEQNGTVMAWIVDDSENSGMYKLYIGGNGGVYAPSSSTQLFSNFSEVISINLANLDTSKVTNMNSMFAGCTSLETLDLSSFDTGNVTDIHNMFNNVPLVTLNLSNWSNDKITDMNNMFVGKTTLKTLKLNNFKTTNVTNMYMMFAGCTSLETLDLSSFDTSNVTNMAQMFVACTNLTSLDLCSFDTSKVTSMVAMFASTTNLKQVNVGTKWTTENATTKGMFDTSGVSSVTTGQC